MLQCILLKSFRKFGVLSLRMRFGVVPRVTLQGQVSASTSTSLLTVDFPVRNSQSNHAQRRLMGSHCNFRAYRVDKTSEGSFDAIDQVCSSRDLRIQGQGAGERTENRYNQIGHGDILIRVTHSSLNYKDALSASGHKGVTRSYPHTPGIDAAGYYVVGKGLHQTAGSALVTGYDLGMNTDGGFGELIRVPSEWVISPNPFGAYGLAMEEVSRLSMIYGTAGLTAALCVSKLLEVGSASPENGSVLVTGASGGVGSIAVELLAKLGFKVVAMSGKNEARETLMELGASEVIGREVLRATEKPLLRHEYAHAIDTVGGLFLTEILKKIQPGGSIAACGNVAGIDLSTSVLPFILRGVQLLGIYSAESPLSEKRRMWAKLATDWRCPVTEKYAMDIGRNQLDDYIKAMLRGESSGRVVLDHSRTENHGHS